MFRHESTTQPQIGMKVGWKREQKELLRRKGGAGQGPYSQQNMKTISLTARISPHYTLASSLIPNLFLVRVRTQEDRSSGPNLTPPRGSCRVVTPTPPEAGAGPRRARALWSGTVLPCTHRVVPGTPELLQAHVPVCGMEPEAPSQGHRGLSEAV